jgi:hypothetical protein
MEEQSRAFPRDRLRRRRPSKTVRECRFSIEARRTSPGRKSGTISTAVSSEQHDFRSHRRPQADEKQQPAAASEWTRRATHAARMMMTTIHQARVVESMTSNLPLMCPVYEPSSDGPASLAGPAPQTVARAWGVAHIGAPASLRGGVVDRSHGAGRTRASSLGRQRRAGRRRLACRLNFCAHGRSRTFGYVTTAERTTRMRAARERQEPHARHACDREMR